MLKLCVFDDLFEFDHHIGQLHDGLAEARGHIRVVCLHPFHHLIADFDVKVELHLQRGLDFSSVGKGRVELAVLDGILHGDAEHVGNDGSDERSFVGFRIHTHFRADSSNHFSKDKHPFGQTCGADGIHLRDHGGMVFSQLGEALADFVLDLEAESVDVGTGFELFFSLLSCFLRVFLLLIVDCFLELLPY